MIRRHTKTHTHHKDRGTAPPSTEGLDALDRERAASLADEGGSSAARVERLERAERSIPRRANRDDEPLSKRRWIFVPFTVVLVALAVPPLALLG